jgi:alpha-glucosidase (family GH31 glycosyl hydrolase)
MAWWTAKRRYLLDEVGVDGFKTDGGEHAWSPELRYADGTRGGETNNRYPVRYAQAFHELMRDCGRTPVTFSRAGYVGSQAFPAHWAGDEDSTWEALRASISAGLTASACGVFFWSFDLGGFSGPLPTAELYLRAAAIAALCPIMQYHSEFNFHRSPSRDRTPWNIAEQTGESSVISTFRSFVLLRERLVPYLAAQGRQSIEQSKPLMRALFFETDDERQWEFPYQYFLGDGLLVAPVVEEGATSQRVYLPDGEWVDASNGSSLAGGSVIECECPINRSPVFVAAERADALAPLFHDLAEVS